MTTYNHCADSVCAENPKSQTFGVTSAFQAFAKFLRERQKLRVNRAAFNSMLSLDDRMLSDIGVTRDNVRWASKLPLHMNAAEELQKLSQKSGTLHRN